MLVLTLLIYIYIYNMYYITAWDRSPPIEPIGPPGVGGARRTPPEPLWLLPGYHYNDNQNNNNNNGNNEYNNDKKENNNNKV